MSDKEKLDILLDLLVGFELEIPCLDLNDDPDEYDICCENCDYSRAQKDCWLRWVEMKAKIK